MILLNNSQKISVSKIKALEGSESIETATVTVEISRAGEIIETLTLSHVGKGVYEVDIPLDLNVENNRSYILKTKILAEGYSAEWEESVRATKRRKNINS